MDRRTLTVDHADALTLVLAAATDFVSYHDVSGDPAARVARVLPQAAARGYQELRQAHEALASA